MKPKFVLLCLMLSSLSFAQEQKPTINDLAWLAGCWERSGNGREGVEQWMKPAGQTMLGMSRTVANGKLREFEFLQLRTKEDGSIHYVALPSGQQETWFKLVKSGKHEAVFENLEHDFPQRIIYRLEKDGSLLARIEGMSKGQLQGIDFPMKRGKCE
ncbi:MAG: DUF6265 family protein [candidate division KSB1 bacterium]